MLTITFKTIIINERQTMFLTFAIYWEKLILFSVIFVIVVHAEPHYAAPAYGHYDYDGIEPHYAAPAYGHYDYEPHQYAHY